MIEKYCREKYLDFWERSDMPDCDKVQLSKFLQEGYGYIAKKVKDHHGDELNPKSIRDIYLLEGFLITFVQHAIDKEQLRKIGAIIG